MSRKLVIFDTETGGLEAGKHALLTLAMVVWEDDGGEGKLGPTLDLKVWDGRQVEAAALRVNGIDLERHRSAALSPQAAVRTVDRFLEAAGMVSGGPWVELGGHNSPFDVPFLRELWNQAPGCARPFGKRFSFVPRCTWAQALWLRDAGALPAQGSPELPDLKLGSLCRYFGIPLEGAHSALADTVAAARLYGKFNAKLSQMGARERVERCDCPACRPRSFAGTMFPGTEPDTLPR